MEKAVGDAIVQSSASIREVKISKEPIELYKILKFESMVGSGGEAKAAVAAGMVLLNGEIETQKRKKVVSGDIVEFGEEKIRVQFDPSDSTDSAVNVVAEKKPEKSYVPAKKSSARNQIFGKRGESPALGMKGKTND